MPPAQPEPSSGELGLPLHSACTSPAAPRRSLLQIPTQQAPPSRVNYVFEEKRE